MANLFLIVFINFVGIGALIPVLPFTVIDGLGHSEIVMTALLAIGQLLTVALAFGDARGLVIVLGPILLSTTLVCVGFAFTNPTLTASASKAASARDMGGSLGFMQGCGSIGQVLGLLSAGPFYAFGGGVASFGFGTAVTCCLLVFILMMLSR